MRVQVLLEYEVGSVGLLARGAGYGSSQDLNLRFFSSRYGKSSNESSVERNFKTRSEVELADKPWSLEAMAAKYGDSVTAKSTDKVLVLRPPRATLVLGEKGATQRCAHIEPIVSHVRSPPVPLCP